MYNITKQVMETLKEHEIGFNFSPQSIDSCNVDVLHIAWGFDDDPIYMTIMIFEKNITFSISLENISIEKNMLLKILNVMNMKEVPTFILNKSGNNRTFDIFVKYITQIYNEEFAGTVVIMTADIMFRAIDNLQNCIDNNLF